MTDRIEELRKNPKAYCHRCFKFLIDPTGRLVDSVATPDFGFICMKCLREEILGDLAPLVDLAPQIESLMIKQKGFIMDINMLGKGKKKSKKSITRNSTMKKGRKKSS
jgi:hypothetical protein